jgi:hypothetical protein
MAENTCEHGDHPAPDGKRFCSYACLRCEHSAAEQGCDGTCHRLRIRSAQREALRELRALVDCDQSDCSDSECAGWAILRAISALDKATRAPMTTKSRAVRRRPADQAVAVDRREGGAGDNRPKAGSAAGGQSASPANVAADRCTCLNAYVSLKGKDGTQRCMTCGGLRQKRRRFR